VRDALSVGVELSDGGDILDVQLAASRIRVTHQLTYDQADEVIAGAGSADDAAQDLAALRAAADVRRVYREQCGCIEIPLPESKVCVFVSSHFTMDSVEVFALFFQQICWSSAALLDASLIVCASA
jgi:exoribonuclease R